jgi:ribosomal protein S18 acetylase RimI-like enzyme
MIAGSIAGSTAEEDLEAAARLMRACFDGQENARLGPAYALAWMRTFSSGDAWLALERRDGQVVGFAVGVPEPSLAAHYRSLRGVALRSLALRPWLWVRPDMLAMAARRLHGEAPRAISWFLPLIGVAPSAWGRGIGRSLVAAFEAEGRRRGQALAALSVRVANGRAVRLYEGAGWRRVRQFRARCRYEKALG